MKSASCLKLRIVVPSSRTDPDSVGHHVVNHRRVLGPVVFGVGEQEGQQVVVAEPLQGPEERGDVGSGVDVGRGVGIVDPGRGEDRHRFERRGRETESRVPLALLVVEPGVGPVEVEQVFALHVEDQALGVDGGLAQDARGEQGVEEESGVGGLGGHPRDAGDVDVGASLPVDELQIHP
jgi:hypothetical protein